MSRNAMNFIEKKKLLFFYIELNKKKKPLKLAPSIKGEHLARAKMYFIC